MQAAVRMDGVVVLEPFGQALEDRDGVWPWVHADVVALEGLHEGLADAVALGAADGREAGDEVQGGGEVDGFAGGVRPNLDSRREQNRYSCRQAIDFARPAWRQ